MKRQGYLTDRIADIDNLLEAFRKASRGKQCKAEVAQFREDFDANILSLRQQIVTGDIDVGHYHHFTIFEPKERIICAAEFRERVLHHAIMNVCHDSFDRTLIDSTYATRRGKGLYAAIDKAVTAMAQYEYTVKLDVRKYYDSISHGILKQALECKFKDKRLLCMFGKIIDSYSVQQGYGLPIGNLTSQYFANFYLSPLDHFAKEQLHVPIYMRYMDDILIAGETKKSLVLSVSDIQKYASARLGLSLKPPVYRSSVAGQSFLGYRVLPYRYLLSGRSKKRFRSKLTEYDRRFGNGEWSEQKYHEHILPLVAFARHAISDCFRRSCIKG